MAITYSTTINQMFVVSQPDPDYVVSVVFTVTGTDGQYTASTSGSIEFNSESTNGFVPYADLKQNTVVGWVNDLTDNQAAYQANVANQIEQMKNPPVVPQLAPLPWITPNPIPAE